MGGFVRSSVTAGRIRGTGPCQARRPWQDPTGSSIPHDAPSPTASPTTRPKGSGMRGKATTSQLAATGGSQGRLALRAVQGQLRNAARSGRSPCRRIEGEPWFVVAVHASSIQGLASQTVPLGSESRVWTWWLGGSTRPPPEDHGSHGGCHPKGEHAEHERYPMQLKEVQCEHLETADGADNGRGIQ